MNLSNGNGGVSFMAKHTWFSSTIYLGRENKDEWKKFKEICKREESTASKRLLEFIKDYNLRHDSGNPQQRLDTIQDLGKAYRAESCQTCGAQPEFEGYDGKRWLRFCSAHFRKNKYLAFRPVKKN